MIDIIVREVGDSWRVERGDEVVAAGLSDEEAIKAALGEADRSFQRGEQAQVLFRPAEAESVPLAVFS